MPLCEDAYQLRWGRGPQTNAALNHVVVSLVVGSGAKNVAAVQCEFAFLFDRLLARAASADPAP